eukprot:TRINITY_DN1758_c0_g1_i1.p1 TRINITY_DN1758_c0_g1~~TRINITY_DN1758_c0_g1_i1.p1  ORF type:complete len:555 (-),score=156.43 TRINITY_DN1758_c0_g1_i1:332-1996(-)
MATQIYAKILSMCFVICSGAAPGNFRGGSLRTVDTEQVEQSLRDSMEAVLRGGNDAFAKELERIESHIWQTYQALPKNDLGRLGPRGVRYLVHNYFAREHGWLIQGLEPHGNRADVSEVHEVSILQDKAPALVESLLEAQRGDRGLSVSDVVTMVAALERLIFSESLTLLNASYSLNGLNISEPLEEQLMHEVLTSYLLLFELGHKANLQDSKTHKLLKKRAASKDDNWQTMVKFEEDAVENYKESRSVSSMTSYSFQATSDIVERLASGYGKWQDKECRSMKKELMSLDSDGSGRVSIDKFYSQPDSADYHFSESTEYLKQIGALDESNPSNPRVRIANYMAGPSNCIAKSTYYSVCCLSECEGLMNQLEAKVQAPTAAPERLLSLVSSMSSSSVSAPRQLSPKLADKLQSIAAHHGDEVPLHGRLFAQWLHHAFPNECPYPEITEDSSVLTPSHWMDKQVTAKDREELAQASSADKSVQQEEELLWSDEELLHAEPSQPKRSRGLLAGALRLAMQAALLLGLLRLGLGSWQSVKGARGLGSLEKAKKFDLPF